MKLYVVQIIFVLIILTIAAWQFLMWETSFIEPEPEPGIEYYRLPNTAQPLEQFIRLQPFINGNRSVIGYTEITFTVLQATRNITLHMKDIITFNDTIRVSPADNINKSLPISKHTYDPERNFYVCQLGKGLSVGSNYTIFLGFQAYLNDNLIGFYRSFYVDGDGEVKRFAVSQYAPNYARYAFPCYDEPSKKAKFQIEIVREEHMNAVSNMPKISSAPAKGQLGWIVDTFGSSFPMSSYLVAFLVSDLVSVTSTWNNTAEFTVWSREATIAQSNYALSIGPPILTFYEEYFGIPYPLPKQDMAAVPDFYYGAMENWGLIIFRETRLLYDPAISSAQDLQNICAVVAHELAHQWYGNLVTMEWWDDVWLNEGFASFMEYYGCDYVEPDFGMIDQFILNDLQKAFEVDALITSHPLSNPITSPSQIGSIYDTIAYSKGASLIRMMDGFLTQSTFQKGVSNYVDHFSYSNANKDDLWRFLTQQGYKDKTFREDLTIKDVMDTWTVQVGYPVLNVQRFNNGNVIIKQERFLQEIPENSTDTVEQLWWIPLTYTTQDSPDFENTTVKDWMSNSEKEKILGGFPARDKWFIFNIQQIGYYRVNYDTENWNAIISQLQTNNTIIQKLNRAQILDDGYSLAKTGRLSYEIILRINTYLNQELEYVPIATALKQLQYLYNMFLTTSSYQDIQAYMIDLLAPLYDQIGFEDDLQDFHQDQLKRSLILSWSCRIRHDPCVSNSVNLYSVWMENHDNVSIISPNLRKTVFCTAIHEGAQNEWEFAYSQYLRTNVGNEKNNLLYGMGCTPVIWIIKRYLELALNETSGIRKQDMKEVFKAISEHPVGNQLAWDYLRENSHRISLYGGPNTISDMAEIISKYFNTKTKFEELEAFQESLGKTVNLHQSIERVKNNVKWMTDYYNVITTFLRNNNFLKKAGQYKTVIQS